MIRFTLRAAGAGDDSAQLRSSLCSEPVPGTYIELDDANAVAGTTQTIASVPLNTSNQQVLLELTKPDPASDTVDGY